MGPTHNVGTLVFIIADPLPEDQQWQISHLLVLWFAQEADSIELFFELFEDEICNMNKTCYRNFYTYTEAKNEFILAEELKASNTNKSSETKKSKDNSSRAANSGKNKNSLSRKKMTSRVITTLPVITISPWSELTADRMVTSQLNASKTSKGRATTVNNQVRLELKNVSLMTWTLQKRKNSNNSKHGVNSRGRMIIIPPEIKSWRMLN